MQQVTDPNQPLSEDQRRQAFLQQLAAQQAARQQQQPGTQPTAAVAKPLPPWLVSSAVKQEPSMVQAAASTVKMEVPAVAVKQEAVVKLESNGEAAAASMTMLTSASLAVGPQNIQVSSVCPVVLV